LNGEDFKDLNKETSPGVTFHSSNETHWYREKKPTGKTHVSGSSLNSQTMMSVNY
jgi:hypothetical protein